MTIQLSGKFVVLKGVKLGNIDGSQPNEVVGSVFIRSFLPLKGRIGAVRTGFIILGSIAFIIALLGLIQIGHSNCELLNISEGGGGLPVLAPTTKLHKLLALTSREFGILLGRVVSVFDFLVVTIIIRLAFTVGFIGSPSLAIVLVILGALLAVVLRGHTRDIKGLPTVVGDLLQECLE
jgi:hypothetical protein